MITAIIINSFTKEIKKIKVDKDLYAIDTHVLTNTYYYDCFGDYYNNIIFGNAIGFQWDNTFFKLKNPITKWIPGIGLLAQVERYDDKVILSDCDLDINLIKDNVIWCQADDEKAVKILEQQNNESDIVIEVFTLDDLLDYLE